VKLLTEEEARDLLERAVEEAGSRCALAKQLGYTSGALYIVFDGSRPIPPRVLKYLGLEKVTAYKQK
jgi:hypothetical protein